jgi:hypothetical protein
VSTYEQWCRQGADFIGPTTWLVNVVIRSVAQVASFCRNLVGNVACSLSLRVAHGPYRHRRLARRARIVLGSWRAVARHLRPPSAAAVRNRRRRRIARRPLVRGAGKLRRGPSTTLADLLTPLLAAKPFSAVRASLRQWLSDEFEDGVAHGWQRRLRRWPVDSFFPALLI